MLKLIIASGILLSSVSFAMDHSDHVMMTSKEITWVDGPVSLPPGAKSALLFGDPTAAGQFSMRLKFPAKYRIGPHTHPQDENITVISGAFFMGTGEDAKGKMKELPAGSFARMKVGTKHFARTDKETIVQLNGMGPWEITYVNPDDDPRHKK